MGWPQGSHTQISRTLGGGHRNKSVRTRCVPTLGTGTDTKAKLGHLQAVLETLCSLMPRTHWLGFICVWMAFCPHILPFHDSLVKWSEDVSLPIAENE